MESGKFINGTFSDIAIPEESLPLAVFYWDNEENAVGTRVVIPNSYEAAVFLAESLEEAARAIRKQQEN